ncbi:MAG: glycoside hydrolase family 3 C-terminal domain-containing protein [Bacteroidetes bacterium]|nr:glycoside hydrolase family 3 C-terminal domain-containing protein [Bacteroidota bacterium]
MKSISFLLSLCLILTGASVATSWAQDSVKSPQKTVPAYLDTNLTFQQRAADLVSMMTLKEKISQMQNGAAAIPRLGVPAYNWWSECLHGVANNGIATVFPQAIGMAATWNPKLIHEEATVISTEARAKYNNEISKGEYGKIFGGLTFWAPNINIFRDPRWGRGQETYGEDPFLTSQFAVAFVTGLQGNNPKYLKVVSTPKHFDAYSGPELLRHKFSANVSMRDLYDTYTPAFKAAVMKGHAFSVMGAYNAVNGIPCNADSFLMTYLLRDKWGFEGYVVSDCGAIGDIFRGHHYAPSMAAASADAVNAGCDLSCGTEFSTLDEAVKEGLISVATIDSAVTKLMLARFKLGMFDPPSAVPYSKITMADNNTPAHMALARKVADESIVLLKNAHNTLPLSKKLKSIAVVGLYAQDINILLGNYNGTPSNPVTIYDGIKSALGSDVKVHFAAGYNLLEDKIMMPRPIETQYLNPGHGFKEHGLYAEYFNNVNLEGKPALTRVDVAANQFWGSSSPGKGVSPTDFSMRWTATVIPPATGKYKIGIFCPQKGRLYLDGKLIVDNWNMHEGMRFKTGTVHLTEGNDYSLKVEFADSGTSPYLGVVWHREVPEVSEKVLLRDAVAAAKKSDVVIAVAGISPQLESEENPRINLPGFKGGDRTRLRLPAEEEAMLKALHKTGKPIVLVLVGGSALGVNWAKKNIPAIMDCWYPGEEGGNAVADVIFGDYDPAGRLPVTFYKSVKQLPPFTDYNMKGRTYRYFAGTPLYPFGYGLSYTTFGYSDMKVDRNVAKPGEVVRVSVDVKNTGKMDGDEVVQLYVRHLDVKGFHAIKSLKGFERVPIRMGETRTVDILLPVKSLATYNVKEKKVMVEPGKYELQIGSSSRDIKLKQTLTVE